MSFVAENYVWSPNLIDVRPIVHRYGPDRVIQREGRAEHRTPCGMAVLYAVWPLEDRGTSHYEWRGTHLLTRHAEAMGARFCRRCWPDGAA